VTTYEENPPWADKILNKHFDRLVERVGIELMPLPELGPRDERGVLLPVRKARKKAPEYTELGCGHYGCVYETTTPGWVFKITSDPTEAEFITASMTLPEHETPGIVKYKGVWQIPGELHKRRPVFVLIREEAENVGGLIKASDDQQDYLKARSVMRHLEWFKELANRARTKIQASKNPDILLEVARFKPWAEGNVSYSSIERWIREGSPWERNTLRDWLKGAQAAAYGIQAARIVAADMQNEDVGYLIGETLGYFLDEDLLLADVHANNVGQVRRKDYGGPIWVITDPGHMVPLSLERWGHIEVPEL